MTDYPNKSGEGQNQGTSQPQSASSQKDERQAAGLGGLQEKATQDIKDIREVAEAQARSALEKSTEIASEKKNLIAEQLAGVASALEKVGGEMAQGQTAIVGRYASDLGGSAKRLAEDLKNRDMSEIVSMAEDFGRRQPVAFLGLAAIAGLAASRFVTASGSRARSTARMNTNVGSGAETSANPMAGRETVREVTPSAPRPTPQAGQSSTGQSASRPAGSTPSQASSSSGMGLRTPGVSGAGQSASGQSGSGQPGSTSSSQSGFGQGSNLGASTSRPGAEATGIGGTGLGTSRDKPASSADTPTLNASGPNPASRVQLGETAIGQSPASPAQPNGQASTRTTNTSSEGRSNV